MKSKRILILMWILALVPPAALAVLYGNLPEKMPMHWNIHGEVDRWGGKGELWLLALLPTLMTVLLYAAPRIDPRKNNYEKFQKYYDSFALVMVAFMGLVFFLSLMEGVRPGTVSMGRVISAAIGLLFLFMGNMMGKIKQNFFFGVRTPWAISDPDVWNKTHRLAGGLFVLSGLLTLLSAVFLPEVLLFIVLMGAVIVSSIGSIFMSYWYYRKKERQ